MEYNEVGIYLESIQSYTEHLFVLLDEVPYVLYTSSHPIVEITQVKYYARVQVCCVLQEEY